MNAGDLTAAVSSIIISSLSAFVSFIPSLIGGLIVLIIGLVLGAVVYRLIVGVLKTLQIEKFLAKYGVTKLKGRDIEWAEILGEVARWSVIITFLLPTLDAWRLSAVNVVLNRVILYIPNVIVAVILALVGLVLAKLAFKVTTSATHSLGKDLANTVGLVAQWSITVFVIFLVLHQLGVAQELLRILFGGLVAMFAIAGGIAFGLGGQGTAQKLLESVWDRFKK